MKYSIGNINDFTNEELDNFYNKIPQIKKKIIDKKRSVIAKKQSIIGELLLSRLTDYNDVDYFIDNNGKPYIKGSNLYHSISHSYDYVVTTISDKEIGIDIEKIREVNLKTLNKFATKKEKEYIISNKNLFEIYTLKEAYYKMNGNNLDDVINTEFIIKDNKVSCSIKNIKAGLINDIEGYIIAYCEKKTS